MKWYLLIILFTVTFLTVGCSHNMHITNLEDNFMPPEPTPQKTISIGVKSNDSAQHEKSRYVSSIVDAMQRSGCFEKIIFPYDHAKHNGEAEAVVDIAISPVYSGSKSNFWINFPGFLIFAPAAWGYGYHADINTVAIVSFQKEKASKNVSVRTKYDFRQAEIDRTWTEIGWLEVGIIPLIGGFVFTDYDPDVTPEFITKVSHNYGTCVARKITSAIYEN